MTAPTSAPAAGSVPPDRVRGPLSALTGVAPNVPTVLAPSALIVPAPTGSRLGAAARSGASDRSVLSDGSVRSAPRACRS